MKELLKHSKAIQVGMSRIFWKKLNRIYFSNKDLN